jgi:D-alanyl-D-alanine endopeptidase (penicillin-binding protein 7)
MRFYPTRFWSALLALLLAVTLGSIGAEAEAKPRPAKVAKAGAKAKAKATVKARAGVSKKKGRVAVARKARPSGKQAVLAARRAPAMPQLRLVDGKPVVQASVAYVVDQDSGEVLLGKNDEAVRPIASLTKLMTGMIVAEAQLPLDEAITITDADVDRLKRSSSRLQVGTSLTRGQALHLTLMSSENRAAHALARTYPGGSAAFVDAMNNKARQLGMHQTRYVDSSGLSSENRSSARDLALLADAAHDRAVLRRYSTSPGYRLDVGRAGLQYVNSNKLVREGDWPIGLQKTGYISEAGQCLVVQTQLKGRNLIMVFLDSATKVTRIHDAEAVRRWLGTVTAEAKGD